MDCSFCKKTFSTKTILSTHQRTAKYCLEIQGKENKNFECEYCKKIFTSLQSLSEHNSNSCKSCSLISGFLQNALIGACHQIPPSSIKKLKSGTWLGMLVIPKIKHEKYLS